MDGRDLLYSYEFRADCLASAATIRQGRATWPVPRRCTAATLLLRYLTAAGAQLQYYSHTTLTGWCTRQQLVFLTFSGCTSLTVPSAWPLPQFQATLSPSCSRESSGFL
jgi:hypothetical protein